ncbi:MAG: AAA family ATPase [Chlorobium sp.]|uniref:AAA family ATPase n=1 Tax=Chlorobium sp. TaxID=1095 RepID=UPI0025BAD011|nr:AAA family ATPase [Chlorobium sp.]MCF8383815.1 AAA family ATPase [Chlorobium sp.]
MKILSLRFKNLNSLAGEWFVDFTAPEYVSDGIFAITGPTGSGKTTILDAVSLALYGQTPRLEKVNASGNEIMTRHTGECFAEVVFETGAGRYRCHWSQHRARRNPQGSLQSQKHEISDESTGRIIESKVQDTLAAVVERTGMDFEQFTRSMLLAQGGFTAFLQAQPDERAPVLEQITGTAIYSLISVKVHERNRLEQQKLDLLRDECSGIRLPGEGELAETEASLKGKEAEEAAVAGRQSRTEAAQRWLRQIAVMQAELAGMEGEFRDLVSREERFHPDRQRLEKAVRAARFEPAYSAILQLRQLQERELQEKSAAERELEFSKTVFEERSGVFCEAEGRLMLLKEETHALSGVARQVRALDLQIAASGERCLQAESELGVLQKRIGVLEGQLASVERELLVERKSFEDAGRYLSEHAADSTIAASLSGIGEKVRQSQAARAEERDARKALDDASKRLERAAITLRELTPATAEAEDDFRNCLNLRKELSGRLEELLSGGSLRELRMEADGIRERIRALETLQARLVQLASFRERSVSVRQALGSAEAELKRSALELERITQLQRKEEELVEGLQREAELQGKIRALEEERGMLQEGRPCPLCGSTHHPFAGEEPPAREMAADDALRLARLCLLERGQEITLLRIAAAGAESERRQLLAQRDELHKTIEEETQWCRKFAGTLSIGGAPTQDGVGEELSNLRLIAARRSGVLAEAERIDAAHAGAAGEEKILQQRLTGALRRKEGADYVLKTAEADVARATESASVALLKQRSVEEVLNRELAAYAIAAADALSYAEALLLLQSRLERWQEAHERKVDSGQRITVLEGNRSVQEELLKTIREDCRQKESGHAAEREAFSALQGERALLFGAKNPDEEERRTAAALKSAEEAFEEARAAREEASQQIVTLSERVAMLAATSGERETTIFRKLAGLEGELSGSSFESLESFLSARLDRPQLDELEKEASLLAARRLELETLQVERQKKLRQEEDRALSESSPKELQEELERLSGTLGSLRSDIAGLKLRLQEHERAALLLREKTAALAAQEIECGRWSTLHELVGSSDGKKFRNFAQGLTFEIMIGHANRQLAAMTDRYLLVQSQEPLGLDVIDTWQAGEVRSTKNLSGGESFIVSLALALGLSQMSSRNVRVDSLFLDEGFGTLDEEALDTALQTLAGLRQNGKVIGIISHVPALKERIAARIRVHRVSGGRSRLSGPGVSGGIE